MSYFRFANKKFEKEKYEKKRKLEIELSMKRATRVRSWVAIKDFKVRFFSIRVFSWSLKRQRYTKLGIKKLFFKERLKSKLRSNRKGSKSRNNRRKERSDKVQSVYAPKQTCGYCGINAHVCQSVGHKARVVREQLIWGPGLFFPRRRFSKVISCGTVDVCLSILSVSVRSFTQTWCFLVWFTLRTMVKMKIFLSIQTIM